MAQLSQFAGRYTEMRGILGTGSHCYGIVRLTSAATPPGVILRETHRGIGRFNPTGVSQVVAEEDRTHYPRADLILRLSRLP